MLLEPKRVTEFWMTVEIKGADDCWPWKGYTEDGYGKFFVGKMIGAHELALTFTTGETRLPELDTRHSCDNPACCNPKHLSFGTRQQNVDDMFDRGRAPVGEDRPNSKLTDDAVVEIRRRRAAGAKQKDLAEQYGVSAAYVSDIVNGLVWQHAGGPIGGRARRIKRSGKSRTLKAA